MFKGKFIDNLPKIYGTYTGGFLILSHFKIIEFKTIFLSKDFSSSAIGDHSYKAKALSLNGKEELYFSHSIFSSLLINFFFASQSFLNLSSFFL